VAVVLRPRWRAPVARASWLLCDVKSSPLYARLPDRTLRRIVGETLAALHEEP
jgi:hypothetical protein